MTDASVKEFLSGFPCPALFLDGDFTVLHQNDAAAAGELSPDAIAAVLDEADRAALHAGQPVFLSYFTFAGLRLPLSLTPFCGGYLALTGGARSSPLHTWRSVTDELRSPMQAIFSCADLLAQHTDESAEALDALRLLDRQSYRMLRSVTDLSYGIRLESGENFPLHSVELGSFLRVICDSVKVIAPTLGLDFSFRLPEQDVSVLANTPLLELAFAQLLHNAAQYAAEDKTVTISLSTVGRRAVVRVSDRGMGIRAEAAAHVFEPCYSADPYGDGRTPGAGLGLYLTRSALRAMGGDCVLESEYGKGTSVTFTLRLSSDPPEVGNNMTDYLLNRLSPVYVQFGQFGALPSAY